MPTKNKTDFRFAYSLSQKAESEEAEIMLYNEIVQYKWYKDDPEITAQDFDKMLKDAKASGATKLRLRINCPGGSVWQAVAMKAMLDNSDFEEINVDIEGLCASAATFFVCVKNAKVRIAQGSEFMIHNPRTWGGGTADDFKKTADRLYMMQDDQHEMYANRTGKTPEQIKTWMDAETWMNAKQAVENGFADELMESMDAAACVSADCAQLMQEIYQSIPEEIAANKGTAADKHVRIAEYSASEYINTHKEGQKNMDINEITQQQLQDGNPELYQSIFQAGANAERERMEEIDALTDEGFEEMAREAKKNGTSAADFLRQVVKARNDRKASFLNSRKSETAPAQTVTGGSAEDNNGKNEADEIAKNAKEMAEYAKEFTGSGAAMF